MPDSDGALTEVLVDALEHHPRPMTTMELSLKTMRPYPDVLDELHSLEVLGIVVRQSRGRDTLWLLG